jgi:hypothetical protein
MSRKIPRNIKKISFFFSDKIHLFKIIIFDYFVCKNWFVNIIVCLSIYLFNKAGFTFVIGPLIGSILTFNLINGYSYYSKYRQWNRIKNTVLFHVNDFILFLSMYLQCHRFPIIHDDEKEHFKIDSMRDEILISINGKDPIDKKKKYRNIYQNYYDYYRTLKERKELTTDETRLKKFSKFISMSIEKINQNTLISSISFSENTQLLLQLQILTNKLAIIREYCGLGMYKNEKKEFIMDIMELIDQINALQEYI